MKYKELHHQAKHIDRLIDAELHLHGGLFPTPEQLQVLVTKNYPDFYVESCGWHKIVFRNRQANHKVVLKIGSHRRIENDHHTYKRVPESVRHQLFAKIYWHTKYCLLQEYGAPANITPQQLNCIRQAVYGYGVFDVKADNLRWVNGELKIIDANATRIMLPRMLRFIDELKPVLPPKLDELLARISKRFYKT